MFWSSSPSKGDIREFADAVRKIQRHHDDQFDDLFTAIKDLGWQPDKRATDGDRHSFSFSFKPAGFSGYASHTDNPGAGGFGRTIMITGSGDYDGMAVFIQDFIQIVLGESQEQRVTGKAKRLARGLLKEDDFFSQKKIRQIRGKLRRASS